MNSLLLLSLFVLCMALVVWLVPYLAQGFTKYRRHGLVTAINIAEGTHTKAITKLTDAAISTRYLNVKIGSDSGHVAVSDADEKPVGVATDEAEGAEEPIAVGFFGATDETRKGVSADAIAVGDDIYTADSGKIQVEPTVAGTYYRTGRALTAAAGANEVVEYEPIAPVKVVVVAELTAPDTADGSDAGTTQTLANALKADLVALEAALATPAEIKLLNS